MSRRRFLFNGLDADAKAFLDAASITDSTIVKAVNTLVLDLKSNNLWSLCSAIYPFVGGTASTHKFNLKDPRDDDAAYRITFNGTFTHNSNGVTPLTSGYANTNLIPANILNRYSIHFSFYSRTSTSDSGVEIGEYASPSNQLCASYVGSQYYFNANVEGGVSVSNGYSHGLFIVSRTSDSLTKVYRNNSSPKQAIREQYPDEI